MTHASPAVATPDPTASIRFACPACGKVHQLPAHTEGRKGRCPACRTVLRIRSGLAERYESSRAQAAAGSSSSATGSRSSSGSSAGGHLAFSCPSCGARGKAARAPAGRIGRCHACREQLRIPSADEPARSGTPAAPAPAADAGAAPQAPDVERGPHGLELLPAVERGAGVETSARGQRSPYRAPAGPEGGRRGRRGKPRQAGGRGSRRARICLAHERHVRAIAVWQLVTAGLAGIGLLALLAGAAVAALGSEGPAAAAIGGVGLVAALPVAVVGGISALLGWGLWTYQGWARWILATLTGLALLSSFAQLLQTAATLEQSPGLALVGFLVVAAQSAWPLAHLWALLSAPASAIFSEDYRRTVAATGHVSVQWYTSPFFWLPLVLAVLSFFGGLLLFAALASV